MHFSIPDTSECNDKGNTFTVFNLHINGAYHCSVRYRLFHSFDEQLKKEFGVSVLPNFPPKKLLSLSPTQLEERRGALERYIQVLSQNPQIATSDTFTNFLLQAQQESQKETPEEVSLNVYLVNNHKISIQITSTDRTDAVLETAASEVELPGDFVYYFGLYLVQYEDGNNDYSIVRKLQEFESPHISLKAANKIGDHRILLRKSYWDPAYDDDLIQERVPMNLLYVQATDEVDRSWLMVTKEERKQLSSLKQKGSKKEYLRFARTLKFYGYVQFPPCFMDYPHPGCHANIAAGNKELNCRIQVEPDVIKEISFRVTRMRCWRITTTLPESNGEVQNSHENAQLELAFEYLIARDTMQWVTIFSDQAIVISMCLQGMVDELVMKKEGRKFKKPHDKMKKSSSLSNQKRESNPSQPALQLPSPTSEVLNGTSHAARKSKIQHQASTEDKDKLPRRLLGGRTVNNKASLSENYAFEGIGDDDL